MDYDASDLVLVYKSASEYSFTRCLMFMGFNSPNYNVDCYVLTPKTYITMCISYILDGEILFHGFPFS